MLCCAVLCCAVLCCAPISSSAAVSDWLRVHFRRMGSLERAPRTRWTGGEEAASTSTSAATRRTVREAHGRTFAQVIGREGEAGAHMPRCCLGNDACSASA